MNKGNIELHRFLNEINLMNEGYEFYKGREKKYLQIVEYGKQVLSLYKKMSKKRSLTLIDCGAGSCYLSFYLNYLIGENRINFVCIDYNQKLMERAKRTAATLGFTNMQFVTADITAYSPLVRPDIVYSLHACDTATDMALFTGLKSNARHILTVSCCQRYTKDQLHGHLLHRVTKNKVYKERLADMIGDTMRALILESRGYNTDIFEFSSSRNTDKNVMLRATRVPLTAERKARAVQDYLSLRQLFQMEPKLIDFMGAEKIELKKIFNRAS